MRVRSKRLNNWNLCQCQIQLSSLLSIYNKKKQLSNLSHRMPTRVCTWLDPRANETRDKRPCLQPRASSWLSQSVSQSHWPFFICRAIRVISSNCIRKYKTNLWQLQQFLHLALVSVSFSKFALSHCAFFLCCGTYRVAAPIRCSSNQMHPIKCCDKRAAWAR